MPALFLLTPGTRAGLVGERLRVEVPPEDGEQPAPPREIPLNDIDTVLLTDRVALTMPALAEIDLLFNHGGRLWILDCKDTSPEAGYLAQLHRFVDLRSEPAQKVWDIVSERLRVSQARVIKDDILMARELGGLLGHVVCVRRSEPDEQVRKFARDHGVDVVSKQQLPTELKRLLYPCAPADAATLQTLKERFAAR